MSVQVSNLLELFNEKPLWDTVCSHKASRLTTITANSVLTVPDCCHSRCFSMYFFSRSLFRMEFLNDIEIVWKIPDWVTRYLCALERYVHVHCAENWLIFHLLLRSQWHKMEWHAGHYAFNMRVCFWHCSLFSHAINFLIHNSWRGKMRNSYVV